MAGIRNSRRARETRLTIENSLLLLLTKKTLPQVTVKAICEQADINRGTFYIHYHDVQDCMDQIVSRITDQLLVIVRQSENRKNERENFISLLQMLQDDRLAVQYIINNTPVLSTILKKIQTDIKRKEYTNLNWYSNVYYVSGIVGVIREWIDSQQQTVAQIADILVQVLNGPQTSKTIKETNQPEKSVFINDFSS